GRLPCRLDIDGENPRMGDGGAQHIAVMLPLQGDIIRILTRAGDQAKILFTLDRLVDTEFYHGSSPFLWRTPHPSARSCLILSTQTGRFQGRGNHFSAAPQVQLGVSNRTPFAIRPSISLSLYPSSFRMSRPAPPKRGGGSCGAPGVRLSFTATPVPE